MQQPAVARCNAGSGRCGLRPGNQVKRMQAGTRPATGWAAAHTPFPRPGRQGRCGPKRGGPWPGGGGSRAGRGRDGWLRSGRPGPCRACSPRLFRKYRSCDLRNRSTRARVERWLPPDWQEALREQLPQRSHLDLRLRSSRKALPNLPRASFGLKGGLRGCPWSHSGEASHASR